MPSESNFRKITPIFSTRQKPLSGRARARSRSPLLVVVGTPTRDRCSAVLLALSRFIFVALAACYATALIIAEFVSWKKETGKLLNKN